MIKTVSCALLLHILFLGTSIVRAEELVFSTFQDAPIQKLSALIVKEAYASIGVTSTIKEFPGERALVIANGGSVDGGLSRISGIQQKYPNLIRIPVAVNSLQGMVFTKEIDFEVKGWESLKPYYLGIPLGAKFAETGTEGMNRVRVINHDNLFRMLNLGRIDAVISPLINGLSILKKLEMKNIRILEPALIQTDLYHYLHKKNSALVPKISAALSRMKDSGRIKEIRGQFLAEITQ